MVVVLICIVAGVFLKVTYFIVGKMRNSKTQIQKSTSKPLINYNTYTMTRMEQSKYIGVALVICVTTGYVFFKDLYICLLLAVLSLIYPRFKNKTLIKKRKDELNIQFKDAIQSVASSLSAGKSVETAFKVAPKELTLLYPEGAFIITELEAIGRGIEMNETLEILLLDFASRADIEDITNFTDVFMTCKTTGGNLVDVIKNTASVINQKVEIRNEIDVIIAEQKLSQKILNIMPFGLLLFIMSSSPEYVAPLYSPKGHAIMLLVLALLVLSYFIGQKITDIKV